MFKKDMSEQQLEERRLFNDMLAGAGWRTGATDEFFESGVIDVSPEAKAEYENERANLELTYNAAECYVGLLIGSKDTQDFVKFRLYYGSNLPAVLDAVVASQDALARRGFADFIKKMIGLCDEVFMEAVDEGLIRLSL